MTAASTIIGNSTNGAASPADSGITLLDYARVFAEEGMAVFPCHSIVPGTGRCTCGDAACKSPGKHPKTANGVLDATDDIVQITAWFAGAHDTNIGIATGEKSGLVVVDIDSHKGAEPQKLVGDTGVDATAFSTLKVQTGGGMHLYYRLPKGVSVRNSTSKLAPYVDIRGEGGYVIAPGSKHASGKPYVFLDSEADMLEFPAAWVKRLNSRQPAPAAANGNGNGNGAAPGFVVPPPSEGLKVPQLIDHGSRNATLIKLAGVMRHHGFAEDAIFSALWSENNRICKPPLDQKEVHQIAHSAGRYAPKNVITPASINDPDPYEGVFFTAGKLRSMPDIVTDPIVFHLERQEWAVISATKNAGKTTFLRNVAISCAVGRPFDRFLTAAVPRKVLYLDFETPLNRVKNDFNRMLQHLTPAETDLYDKNLIIAPKTTVNGQLFTFSGHLEAIGRLVELEGVDIVIVDNMSAAFKPKDENDNAAINQSVVSPILEFVAQTNTVLVLVHHAGRANHNETYAGRGASVLEDLAPVNFMIKGNLGASPAVTVKCTKRKDGEDYEVPLKLDKATRWFRASMCVVPRQKSKEELVAEFVCKKADPDGWQRKEINAAFPDISLSSLKNVLADLIRFNTIHRNAKGYCAPAGQFGHPYRVLANLASEEEEAGQSGQDGQLANIDSLAKESGQSGYSPIEVASLASQPIGEEVRCKCGQSGVAGNQCPECDSTFR